MRGVGLGRITLAVILAAYCVANAIAQAPVRPTRAPTWLERIVGHPSSRRINYRDTQRAARVTRSTGGVVPAAYHPPRMPRFVSRPMAAGTVRPGNSITTADHLTSIMVTAPAPPNQRDGITIARQPMTIVPSTPAQPAATNPLVAAPSATTTTLPLVPPAPVAVSPNSAYPSPYAATQPAGIDPHAIAGPPVAPVGGLGNCSCGGYGPCGCTSAEPLGASLDAIYDTHVAIGQSRQLVMYCFDFYHGPSEDHTKLNEAGRRKLLRLLPFVETTTEPIVVQHLPGLPQLAEGRRMAVLLFISQKLGVPISENQVVVAPVAEGLWGEEAQAIYRTQLQTLRSQGAFSTSSGNRGQTQRSGLQSGLSGGRR